MSVDLTSAMPGADFSIFNGKQMQIVMKDGEEIPILVRMYFDPIDLIKWTIFCSRMVQSCLSQMQLRNKEVIAVEERKNLIHSIICKNVTKLLLHL